MATLLSCCRGSDKDIFCLVGAVLLEEGVLHRVDADLRSTGGDLTVGLRTTPEMARLRTGVGTGDPLDFEDNVKMGDLVVSGCEDFSMVWSCFIGDFRTFCLDEAPEAEVGDLTLTH